MSVTLNNHISDFARILRQRTTEPSVTSSSNITQIEELQSVLEQAKTELEEIRKIRNAFLYALIEEDVDVGPCESTKIAEEKIQAFISRVKTREEKWSAIEESYLREEEKFKNIATI